MYKKRFNPDTLATKNRQFFRLYYLLRDKEFLVNSGLLKEDVLAYYSDGERPFSYSPDVLLNDGLPNETVALISKLAAHHGVSVEVIRRYLDGYYQGKGLESSYAISAKARVEDGWVVLRMSPAVTFNQYKELWGMVDLARQDLIPDRSSYRHRAPAQYELIYYIEKALKNGMDFKTISGLYASDKLPGYPHAVGEKAYTRKELEGYYNKYKFQS